MEWIPAKTLITKNKSSAWFGCDYNMNIYRGCCHKCIYCDSRSDCYKIQNFDHVSAKKDALIIIEKELQNKRTKGVIATGSMSDPYNPMEKKYQLTRQALSIILSKQFGVAIATKSPLVARDADLLSELSNIAPTIVKMTITTANDNLCKKIEPSVAPSSERFAALKQLSNKGITTGVLLMPILPFINDTKENILSIVQKSKLAGAKFIYPSFGVTLRDSQRVYFYKQLDEKFPGIKSKYIKSFGNAYQCGSPSAHSLYGFFAAVCKEHGLLYRMSDIIKFYQNKKFANTQLSWL